MRRGNGVFTPRERQVALLALLVAGLIAMGGVLIQPLLRPSVGPGGVDAYLTAPSPGVLDATPLVG
jgi:hypothetical protein